MEKSGFFNAMKVGDTWDRVYKAENFAEYFSTFIGNGVFPNPSTNLQVKETDKMQVVLKGGKAWINGFIYINTDNLVLDIPVADGVLNRIDKVVLQYNVAKRDIRAVIKKGEFNSSPTATAITRNADIYELGLADIYVNAGAIKISQSDITDLRFNKNLCGLVHAVVEQIDSTVIFNQFQKWYSEKQKEFDKDISTWTKDKKQEFEKQFMDWFKNLKNIFEGDVAGNLLKKIEQVDAKYEDIEKQKGAKNGIAELDGKGKVKKYQLPKMNDGTILGSDGYYYKPFMEDGKMVLTGKHSIEKYNGFRPKKITENFIYGFDSATLIKLNKKSGNIVCSNYTGNGYDGNLFSYDLEYVYVQLGYALFKYSLNDFSVIAHRNDTTLQINDYLLVCDDKYIYTTSRYGNKGYKINKNTLELVAEYQLNYPITKSDFAFIIDDYIYIAVQGYTLAIINKNDFSIIAKKSIGSDIRALKSYDNYIYLVSEYNLSILNKNTLETIKSIDISNYSKNIRCLFFSKNYVGIACNKAIWVFDKNFNLMYKNTQNGDVDTSENFYFDEYENLNFIGRQQIENYALVHEIKYYKRTGDKQ